MGGLGVRKRINETRWDREGGKPKETLNLTKQTEGCRGEGGRERVVGVMDFGEGMCYGECCEVCKPGDSQTCTPGDKNICLGAPGWLSGLSRCLRLRS